VRTAHQQRILASFEARLTAFEAAFSSAQVAAGGATASSSCVATSALARSRALEAREEVHQAEVLELRSALDGAVALAREHEENLKRHRGNTREVEATIEETERRIQALREVARSLYDDVQRLGVDVDTNERRVRSIDELTGATGASLSKMTALLEGKERRVAEVGYAISTADQSAARLGAFVDAHAQRIQEFEVRGASTSNQRNTPGSPTSVARVAAADNEPVWQALRELQELVVHESEHRAAGLREVLGVLGQGVEQLRSEQGRQASELETRSRADHRRTRQKLSEAQALHDQHEKRCENLDSRLDALSQALAAERCARAEAVAWMEEQVREARGLPPRAGPAAAFSASNGICITPALAPALALTATFDPSSLTPSTAFDTCNAAAATPAKSMVTPASRQRLEALEARFDRTKASGTGAALRSCSTGCIISGSSGNSSAGQAGIVDSSSLAAPQSSSTEGENPFGKLRGQLQGLRSELLAPCATTTTAAASTFAPSPPQQQGPPSACVLQPPQIAPVSLLQPTQFLTRSLPNLVTTSSAPALQPVVPPLITTPRVEAEGPFVMTAPSLLSQRPAVASVATAPSATSDEIFTALDTNGDGVISREEFAAGVWGAQVTAVPALPRARSMSPPKSPVLISGSGPSSPPTMSMLAAPVQRVLHNVPREFVAATCPAAATTAAEPIAAMPPQTYGCGNHFYHSCGAQRSEVVS